MAMTTASEAYQADLVRAKAQIDEREALEVARLAAVLMAGAAGLVSDRSLIPTWVKNAQMLLAESRKQVDEARSERERS